MSESQFNIDIPTMFIEKTQQIVRLGINFSKETRNIENVLIG